MSAVATSAAATTSPAYRLGEGFSRARRPAIGLLVGIVIWEALGRGMSLQFFPPFTTVLARLAQMTASGAILGNLTNSLTNLVFGFARML